MLRFFVQAKNMTEKNNCRDGERNKTKDNRSTERFTSSKGRGFWFVGTGVYDNSPRSE
jgi:hypothetical protein